jgi:hypothetical protein
MPVLGIKTSMDDNYGLLSDKLLALTDGGDGERTGQVALG